MRFAMKFGGGVLADAEWFSQVTKIIKERYKAGHEVVPVVSAVKGVTNRLLKAADEASKGEGDDEAFVKQTEAEHAAILDALTGEAAGLSKSELAKAIVPLQKRLENVREARTLTPADKDFIGSYGERLSCLLLAAFLNDAGVPSETWEPERAGIVTDGCFGDARPQMEQVAANLQQRVVPFLQQRKVPVIAGFYGLGPDGSVTTFNRGGTDYSAAIVAAGLRADAVEVWKAEEGFMTAHPKIVPDARKVAELSYDEAEELSYFGAEILHPRTMEPIRVPGIRAAVKDVRNPHAEGTGISDRRQRRPKVIKSIAAKSDITMVTVKALPPADAPGFAKVVFEAMAEADVNVDAIATTQTAISFTISEADAEKAKAAIVPMTGRTVASYEIAKGLALVGVVGNGLRDTAGVSGRLFSCVGRAPDSINIEMISQGGSDIAISFVIRRERLEDCIRRIHEEFFGAGP